MEDPIDALEEPVQRRVDEVAVEEHEPGAREQVLEVRLLVGARVVVGERVDADYGVAPAASSASERCEPMNPAQPVTMYVLIAPRPGLPEPSGRNRPAVSFMAPTLRRRALTL